LGAVDPEIGAENRTTSVGDPLNRTFLKLSDDTSKVKSMSFDRSVQGRGFPETPGTSFPREESEKRLLDEPGRGIKANPDLKL
jgi:hypothetical protein